METDLNLGSYFYITDREPVTGYIVRASSSSVPPTTASKFVVGAKVIDRSTGYEYTNVGTIAVPVWDSGSITKVVNVTAAEIISNFTTSKEIIPAVAGKAIILDSVEFDLTGTATQFTGGGVMILQYKSTANGAGTTLHADVAASVITGATGRVITSRIPKDLSDTATADITSVGVYLGTKTQVFAAGTGTMKIIAKFHLV
jgi:hypothetical protein